MLAMPVTTVQKITGPMIIRTSLMNRSPSGFNATAACGAKWPSSTPATMAARTWT